MAALRLLYQAARAGETTWESPNLLTPPRPNPILTLLTLLSLPRPPGSTGLPAPTQHQHPQGLLQ